MPTYEYQCCSGTCLHQWEADQTIKEPPLRECPQCKGVSVKRLISRGGGFILQGPGWYRDGYGGGSGD